MQENICKFSSSAESEQDLFAFQFIYETQPEKLVWPHSYAAFCCHLAISGTAVLETETGSWSLRKGDLFFSFPSGEFVLRDADGFKYMYIAFVGRKPSALLESLGVTREKPVFCGMEELEGLWRDAMDACTSRNLSFMTKGVLYCTFARLQGEMMEETAGRGGAEEAVAEIRRAIEREYANPDLSLEDFGGRLGYSCKYLSRCFREITGVSFVDYLTACRIRHACVMLSESDVSIREAALSVGYKDSLYFSKVFKKKVGSAPARYRSDSRAGKGTDPSGDGL